jgi:hypothetical protein
MFEPAAGFSHFPPILLGCDLQKDLMPKPATAEHRLS